MFEVYPGGGNLVAKKEGNTAEHCAHKNKIASLKSHLWVDIVSLSTSNIVRDLNIALTMTFKQISFLF